MTATMNLATLSADDMERALTREEAAAALSRAVTDGLQPGQALKRDVIALAHGQLLLMPAETAASVGLKAVTVAPGNPERGIPRIHGAFLLFGAETLELRAILDGVALTNLRTPAVSIAATRPLFSRFTQPVAAVVFGAGPQAVGHVEALAACDAIEVADVTYVARRPERVRHHLPARAEVLAADDPAVPARLERAGVVVCATSARTPLFDSVHVSDAAVVIAVGSHEPDARELDGPLMERAEIVVEDVGTAMREAGDVVLAVREGRLAVDELIPLTDVVRVRRSLPADRPAVFKSVGMGWQDVVVAEAIMRRYEESAGVRDVV
jgi:ornithine cyclodeaminase/alanine dehydrogenase-like protein (mu-crystallin family)